MKFRSLIFLVYTFIYVKRGRVVFLSLSEAFLPYFYLILTLLFSPEKKNFHQTYTIQSSIFEYLFAYSHFFMDIGQNRFYVR